MTGAQATRARAPHRSTRRFVTIALALALVTGLLSGCRLTGVIQLATGAQHVCVLRSSTDLQCWGENRYGELGDGTTTDRLDPTPVSGLTGMTQVGSGADHTCVLIDDGTIRCWGANYVGQLGDGTLVTSSVPVTVAGITDATQLSVGDYHTCARLADATVRCWGVNISGAIGDGTTTDRGAPVPPRGNLTGVVQVDAGFHETCVILDDGTARCWGINYHGSIGNGTTGPYVLEPTPVNGLAGATAISVGVVNVCALVAGGAVTCWGENGSGQLGDGSTTDRHEPVPVVGLTGMTMLATGGGDFIYGLPHTCASDGTVVWCWGADVSDSHSIGYAGPPSSIPVATAFTDVTDIGTSSDSTCVLTTANDVRCVGKNKFLTLANGTRFGSLEPGPAGRADPVSGFAEVFGGTGASCGRQTTGAVQCWGATRDYLFRSTALPPSSEWLATTLDDLPMVSSFSMSDHHACAVVSGAVVCWGRNPAGELGNGTTIDSPFTPVTVLGITSATQVAVGPSSSCARLSTGSVMCWGDGANGRLGNGSLAPTSIPTMVLTVTTATQITVGLAHACARLSNGRAACWGGNGAGQVGDGTTIDRPTPVAVAGLTTVTVIDAGDDYTCAVQTAGTVRCWGANGSGQLGNGTTYPSLTSRAVPGLTNATQVSAGYHSTCALRADGTAACWGRGLMSLNVSVTTSSATPVDVSGLSGATQISTAASGTHACAVIALGAVQCWGDNSEGQLGDGTNVARTLPAPVKAHVS